jgi:hypothetical protein
MTTSPLTRREVIEWIDGQVSAKLTWLEPPKGRPHPRPVHEHDGKRRDIRILRAIKDWIERTQG